MLSRSSGKQEASMELEEKASYVRDQLLQIAVNNNQDFINPQSSARRDIGNRLIMIFNYICNENDSSIYSFDLIKMINNIRPDNLEAMSRNWQLIQKIFNHRDKANWHKIDQNQYFYARAELIISALNQQSKVKDYDSYTYVLNCRVIQFFETIEKVNFKGTETNLPTIEDSIDTSKMINPNNIKFNKLDEDIVPKEFKDISKWQEKISLHYQLAEKKVELASQKAVVNV